VLQLSQEILNLVSLAFFLIFVVFYFGHQHIEVLVTAIAERQHLHEQLFELLLLSSDLSNLSIHFLKIIGKAVHPLFELLNFFP